MLLLLYFTLKLYHSIVSPFHLNSCISRHQSQKIISLSIDLKLLTSFRRKTTALHFIHCFSMPLLFCFFFFFAKWALGIESRLLFSPMRNCIIKVIFSPEGCSLARRFIKKHIRLLGVCYTFKTFISSS